MIDKNPSPQSVVVRRADLEEVRDLLMERIYGGNARSSGHNARLAVEALLNAAPAPSSLAGGEVLKALLDYIDIQTCTHESTKRGGAIWTICEDCGRKWADDEGGFKPHVDAPAVAAAREYLAALSPEAPAREGASGADMLTMTCFANNHDNPEAWAAWSRIRAALTPRHEAPADDEMFGVTGACGEVEALAYALFAHRCPGIVMHDDDLGHYRDAASRAFAVLDGHEAPAEGAVELVWLDVRDAPQDGTPILLNHRTHGIIQGRFSKGEWSDDTPISPREYSGDMWILGDDLYQDDVEFGEGGVILPSGVLGWLPLSALRARSSAPEAREEALGNLLAVIHGDGGHRALEVGVEQAAAEAEKIVARLLSSAPEAREVEALRECLHCGRLKVMGCRCDYVAAPSADKLRIAVAAMRELIDADKELAIAVNFCEPTKNEEAITSAEYRTQAARSQAEEALAALKAEGAK